MANHSTAPAISLPIPPSRSIANFAVALSLSSVPQAVVDRARLLMLDALGVGLASNAYPFAERSLAGIRALAEPGGTCSVIGRGERFPVRDAALANGILIHGLDFDDTHLTSIIHATAACLPCALTLAESLDASGAAFLEAYMAGMETAVRVGAAVKGGFHHVGFHATGVVAHFSSSVIASKLLGLNAERMVAAQGIAASTASGVQVFLEEGAWTKRFHPGWAAVAGITAARLAEADFQGPTRAYEGKFGFFHSYLQGYANDVDYALISDGLGEVWSFAETAIKPYPVCHFAHGCADAAIELHQLVDSNEIASVEAFLPKTTMPIVAEPTSSKERPTTDYEAKFSAQFIVATCLIKGRFGLPELQPDALKDETVLALTKKVRCSVDPSTAFPTYFSGGVKVMLKDGRELFRHVRVNSGAGERALDLESVTKKFLASASLSIGEDQANEIRDIVLAIENRKVRDLTVALRAR